MHLFSTDFVVSREVRHLLDVGKWGDSGEKVYHIINRKWPSSMWAQCWLRNGLMRLWWNNESQKHQPWSRYRRLIILYRRRRLELFETAGKVFNVLMEMSAYGAAYDFSHGSGRRYNFLVVLTKNNMKKHQEEYHHFLEEIEPEASKRPLLAHHNKLTTGWKRVGKVSRDNAKAR